MTDTPEQLSTDELDRWAANKVMGWKYAEWNVQNNRH